MATGSDACYTCGVRSPAESGSIFFRAARAARDEGQGPGAKGICDPLSRRPGYKKSGLIEFVFSLLWLLTLRAVKSVLNRRDENKGMKTWMISRGAMN